MFSSTTARPLLALALLVALGAAEARAQTWANAATRLHLQATPSATSRTVSSVPEGYPVSVLGCSGGWCEVSYMGVRGFVLRPSLEPFERSAPPAEASTSAPARLPALPPVPTAAESPASPSGPAAEAVPVALAPGVLAAPVPDAAPAAVPALPYKDSAAAAVFAALLPGGGHLYAGETDTGLVLLLGAATALGVGYSLTAGSVGVRCPTGGYIMVCDDTSNYVPLLVGSFVAFGAWVYSVADSGRAVRRYNAALAQPRVTVSPTASGQQAGLSLRVQL